MLSASRSFGQAIETTLRLLGQGGFGAAYQAVRLSGPNSSPDTCVLKVTIDAPTWHREAYFGHLLRHVPALVEVYDSFAWAPGGGRKPLYCLVSEYMEKGDLSSYLETNPKPWPESRARQQEPAVRGCAVCPRTDFSQ